MTKLTKNGIQKKLDSAIRLAKKEKAGKVANYIPELASVDENLIGLAVCTPDGKTISSGNTKEHRFTLQSSAKLIPLIGLLEEVGLDQLLKWTKAEPSGDDFASIARLDQFGPLPSNPMLNSGAISLCGQIPGKAEAKLNWLESWIEKLFGTKLNVNLKVFASEKRTGDRNRALAYMLKSTGILTADVDATLDTYFSLCSYEATVEEAAYLPMILANGGKNPKGEQIISPTTAHQVVALMATCGLYNESGSHLVRTGMPAKSSVSGFILAVAPHNAGIATIAPLVNNKGTSLRGEIMLEHLSKELDWYFGF